MKKRIFKLLVLALILPLTGIGATNSYFSSQATVNNNQFTAGWWVPPTVSVTSPNGGEALYQNNPYDITWIATSSDPAATVLIDLYYSIDGGATYPNTIATGEANDGTYSWTAPNIFSSTVRIKVVATDSHGLTNNDVSDNNSTIKSPIVLNEFVPNPTGNDDAPKPGGEWVELYNNGSISVDVNGWVLYDSDDSHDLAINAGNSDNNGNVLDSGETIVPTHGFLVVYRDGDGSFALNNTGGDNVRLYNGPISSGGILIDSHSYTLSPVPINKSFARIPDGTGAWVDPDPTPGKPNVLTQNYLTSPFEPEPSEVVLELTISDDKKTASFKVSKIQGFKKLSYELTYDTDTVPQGIFGDSDLNNQDEYTKDNLVLGTCSSGGTYVYHTGIKNIKLKVSLTDKGGNTATLEKLSP